MENIKVRGGGKQEVRKIIIDLNDFLVIFDFQIKLMYKM